jgi:hypothetical protein
MEFSWNYEDTMNSFSTRGHCYELATSFSEKDSLAYESFIQFNINPEGCEIPAFMLDLVNNKIPALGANIPQTVISPLYIGPYSKQCAGADTILKFFHRENSGRLNKAYTPKDEIYYGNNGIILDSNFDPLLLIMAYVTKPTNNRFFVKQQYIVHISPKVFTEDTKILNKSLARKAVPYYLTHTSSSWSEPDLSYKVVIDDCSQFIKKPKVPNINKCSNADMTKVLKDNIDEVLKQIVYDYSRGV